MADSPFTQKSKYHSPEDDLNNGAKAVREYENFSAINKNDIFDDKKFKCKSRKQKDDEEINMLNRYVNYSLMKLNDNFVQTKFKDYLKQRANNEVKKETVYHRLMRNAEEKTQENLQRLSKYYKDTTPNDSKFMNHSKQLQDKLKKKI